LRGRINVKLTGARPPASTTISPAATWVIAMSQSGMGVSVIATRAWPCFPLAASNRFSSNRELPCVARRRGLALLLRPLALPLSRGFALALV